MHFNTATLLSLSVFTSVAYSASDTPWKISQSQITLSTDKKSVSYSFEIKADTPKFQATCKSTLPVNTDEGWKSCTFSGDVAKVEVNGTLGPGRAPNDDKIQVRVTEKGKGGTWMAMRFGEFENLLKVYPSFTIFASKM
ncbi:hypothetical protein HII31_06053 [Pseudocercospora fuligena]|uniref:AA1-like domain-containing protein n=1 Tax=Pseudocercospora fuligena TaxID=685502 RepID=A0A8H6RM34_9PEZI|nr:hypothetical protein HII31_06053 [Pseudocercospora fuligena]